MIRVRPLIAVFVIAACNTKDSPGLDTAASPPAVTAHEPTPNEIADYKLNMDKMQKVSAAMNKFAVLGKADSVAAEAMATHTNETMAQTIARIESSPTAMQVLTESGLTPRDYVWITAAWLQAAMTLAVVESSPQSRLPAGQNTQNVEFIRAHRAELDSLMKDVGIGPRE
jgi:hypothetical protein